MDNENLVILIKELQSKRQLESLDEAATKQVLILRVLSLLGWDVYDVNEVWPEYPISNTKVDYSLRYSGKNKVFIEVKRVSEVLEKHQEQLLNYSFKEGVPIAVLTNGVIWWFYLPLQEGSWEQRKFYTINIYDQDAVDIISKLVDYLSKDNIISERAIESARSTYKTRQKEYEITETLPKAWNKIITEPDQTLVDLIASNTESICGYRPDDVTVKNFISSSIPENIEEIFTPTERMGREGNIIKDNLKKKTLDYVLRNASSGLKDLFFSLRTNIMNLGENIREYPNDWYCDFRKSSTFATLNVQTKNNQLLIYIKMGDKKIVDPERWTKKLPEQWSFGKLNTQFAIKNNNQINYAMYLIKQAYDYVP